MIREQYLLPIPGVVKRVGQLKGWLLRRPRLPLEVERCVYCIRTFHYQVPPNFDDLRECFFVESPQSDNSKSLEGSMRIVLFMAIIDVLDRNRSALSDQRLQIIQRPVCNFGVNLDSQCIWLILKGWDGVQVEWT